MRAIDFKGWSFLRMKLISRIKNALNSMKLHSKLMLSYFLVCLIPLLAVEIIFFSTARISLGDASNEFINMYTSQIATSINLFMQTFNRNATSVFVESNTLQYLRNDSISSMEEKINNKLALDTLLLRLSTLNPDAARILIVSAGNTVYQSAGSGDSVNSELLVNQSWFKDILSSKEKFYITESHSLIYNSTNKDGVVFTIARILYNSEGTYAGVLLFEIDPSQILQLNDNIILLKNKYEIKLVITASNGDLIYHSDIVNGKMTWDEILNKNYTFSESHDPEEDMVITQTTTLGKLTVRTIIPQQNIMSRINQIENKVYILTVLSLLFIILVSFLFSRYITLPIKALRENMRSVEKGLYKPLPLLEANDELGGLIKSYNKMITKVDTLIAEVYLAEIKQKQAKLLALQAQINPHMLYNTLESIRMKAHLKNDYESADMIQILARMFRMSLGREIEKNLIRNEVDYSRNFLELQNIRFDNLFSMEVNLTDEILDSPIISLVFQPLIENCITHGFISYDYYLNITIHGSITAAGDIMIIFQNNGNAISLEKADEINQELLNFSNDKSNLQNSDNINRSIGLRNINERIKLSYGNKYYLSIHRCIEGGTEVKILIPKK